MVLSCAVNAALGLGLVVVSIDRTDIGYNARTLEGRLKERAAHVSALEVERGRLLSPYVLEQKAAQFGMRAARPGQIRRMSDAAVNTAVRQRN